MKNIKEDFPIFRKNPSLIYLDSGATSQKPDVVIESIANYYKNYNANPHRGAYDLSIKSTELYEESRETVRRFINAEEKEEIIFTKSSTESLNLLAYSLDEFVNEGDEIVISITEHHANLIPWQNLARRRRAKLKYMYIDENSRLTREEIGAKITERTKIVSVGHMSNALGTINPVKEIGEKAHSVGALFIVDAAQSTPHMKIDIKGLDADFLFFSGHKVLGPMGIGVLYGKRKYLEEIPPFIFGGDMIEYVTEEEASFAPIPEKFEGGTQNVAGAVGLKTAIEYLENIGIDVIEKHDLELTAYALERLKKMDNITLYGPKDMENRGSVISFNVNGVHPHDVSSILNSKNIAIRAGHHCAQPLMKYIDTNSTCRISMYLYNDKEDIDTFIEELSKVRKVMGYES